MLKPLAQWWCDSCGEIVQEPLHGTVEYRAARGAKLTFDNFRIVHNGNGTGGRCRGDSSGDMDLHYLVTDVGEGICTMLSNKSMDPSWAEVFRRVFVPHYEEARRYLNDAKRDGYEALPEKLSKATLIRYVEKYGTSSRDT